MYIVSIAYCLVPVAYCLLPIAYYLLPIPYSLFPIPYCIWCIAYCLLPVDYCPWAIACGVHMKYSLLMCGTSVSSQHQRQRRQAVWLCAPAGSVLRQRTSMLVCH